MGYTVSNMLGQISDENQDLASGYYLYTEESLIAMQKAGIPNPCGDTNPDGTYTGLRPGFMVIGEHRVRTCAGNLVENHLPDVVIVDNPWKPFVKYALVAVVVILLALNAKALK